MKENMESQRKIIIILLLSIVAVIIYLISIQLAYPIFQNTRLIDPLAAMHSLFPLYYIAIALVALAGFACFAWRINNKGIHFLLLLLLAIMLWYTPYYMAEFSHNPDVARDIGMALHVPDILNGDAILFSGYCSNYPSSYIFSWLFINTTSIELLHYMQLFPLLCICMFILLGYAFVSRLFSSRVAFWAMLLAIPGMHYAIFHASAHSFGVLLLLTTMVLLFHRGVIYRILTIFTIIATIICHPISPLLLTIFLAAALIISYIGKIGKTQIILGIMLAVCFAGWFFWPIVPLTSISPEVSENAAIMYKHITPSEFATTREYLSGAPFIYGSIHKLNLWIYVMYALAAMSAILYMIYREYFRWNSLKRCLFKLGGLPRNRLFLIISVFILLVFTVLLAENEHVLLERGLTFVILWLSCLIASIAVELYYSGIISRFISFISLGMIFVLTLSFPVIAYSIEAYTNFPASEQAALEFIAEEVLIGKKTVTTTSIGQLALFTQNFIPLRSPKGDVSEGVDVVVFRSTGYYYTAMRYDLSFEDNGFTRYQKAVNDCDRYNMTYLNQSAQIYTIRNS